MTRLAKATALKDEAVITPQDRRSTDWTERPEARQTRRLQRSFGFLGPTTQSKLIHQNFPIMGINHLR